MKRPKEPASLDYREAAGLLSAEAQRCYTFLAGNTAQEDDIRRAVRRYEIVRMCMKYVVGRNSGLQGSDEVDSFQLIDHKYGLLKI